jgi:hypothetical protein
MVVLPFSFSLEAILPKRRSHRKIRNREFNEYSSLDSVIDKNYRGAAVGGEAGTYQGAFFLHLPAEILTETRKVLLEDEDLREDYPYSDQDVAAFVYTVRRVAALARDVPPPGFRVRS